MGNLMGQFGEAIAAFINQPVVRAIITGALVYIVMVWLATAFWAFQDMRRRHRDPVLPYVAAAFIILVSPLLFPLAVIVYRIVRPGETLAESRERQLSDRLNDLEVADNLHCPGCGHLVEERWLACPACRTRLAHQCLSCKRSMGLDWMLCAWCGTEFGRPVMADVLPAPVVAIAKRAAPAEPIIEAARA
jgi:RNA polymerase subunit RPABC4/transcription elongation factor Spt4